MIRFTQLGFYFGAHLDAGHVLDYDETRAHIADGSLFMWLDTTLPGETFGPSRVTLDDDDQRAALELFDSLANAVDSKRKYGIERNGLALLVAYCFEGIQYQIFE